MPVEIVENLGSDQYLYGKLGTMEVIARARPDIAVAPGDTVDLGVNMARIHLFDTHTGEALALPGAASVGSER